MEQLWKNENCLTCNSRRKIALAEYLIARLIDRLKASTEIGCVAVQNFMSLDVSKARKLRSNNKNLVQK